MAFVIGWIGGKLLQALVNIVQYTPSILVALLLYNLIIKKNR